MPTNATGNRPGHYAPPVAAAAYLLLPVTGLVAYLTGSDQRTRWHGLQAIAIGLAWPLALYLAALGPSIAVRVVFFLGIALWLGFFAITVSGRDPHLPIVGATLRRWASSSAKDGR